MLRALIAVTLLLIFASTSRPAVPEATAPVPVPLIARDTLFGDATRSGARISPDGRWLSWIASRGGVLDVWVAPVDDPARARPMAVEHDRPIRATWWSPDSRRILFLDDHGGDENFRLVDIDVATGVRRDDTPFERARVRILAISPRVKDRLLLGISRRDPHWQDVFSLDLATGALREVFRNDRYDTFVVDADLNLRVAQQTRDDGGVDWFRMRTVNGETTVDDPPLAQASIDDAPAMSPLQLSADGRTLWWLDSRVADTVSLVAQDMASGRTRVVAHDAHADIDAALFDPLSGVLQAWSVGGQAEAWRPAGEAVAADLRALAAAARGEFAITSRSDDDQRWVVTMDRDVAPVSTWLYERRTRRLTPLFIGRPSLAHAPLVAMRPVTITARDGLALPSWLSLPVNARGPVPMVLLVHGGPWEHDAGGYNATHQWLANRGYAVLSVNFRGSSGFGKRFAAAGDREWGGAMQRDLLDAVDWAVMRGVTSRDRVAIMGSSYGGYAVLAGLAFTPTEFACGVDIVGPSSLPTTLAAVPPYWASFRQQFDRRVGDPTTPDGLAMLNERSPLNRADRIARPLLIGQGANDPRVPEAESDRIVAAMKSHAIPVTYIVFADEGHGFARAANRLAFLAVAENFLQGCLGGRAEPVGDALRTSSADVREGADSMPGLQRASATSAAANATPPGSAAAHASSSPSAALAPSSVAQAVQHRCVEIQVAPAEGGGENQARASATSAAMPSCNAASEP